MMLLFFRQERQLSLFEVDFVDAVISLRFPGALNMRLKFAGGHDPAVFTLKVGE